MLSRDHFFQSRDRFFQSRDRFLLSRDRFLLSRDRFLLSRDREGAVPLMGHDLHVGDIVNSAVDDDGGLDTVARVEFG